MIEKPILFSGEMVGAILDGRKTMTRRVMKPQPVCPGPDAYFDAYNGGPQWNWWTSDNRQYLTQIVNCPYGKIGDLLWLREKFAVCDGLVYYAARDSIEKATRWKPSIHMPRWASRITLEITNIRVEQIQDITELEATHEGIVKHLGIHARDDFKTLWDSINNERGYGWDKNPYVWCIEFKRIK